jgi:hypothetical protein
VRLAVEIGAEILQKTSLAEERIMEPSCNESYGCGPLKGLNAVANPELNLGERQMIGCGRPASAMDRCSVPDKSRPMAAATLR